MLAGKEDFLGAAGQVDFALFSQNRDGECVPANSVGVTVSRFKFSTHRCDGNYILYETGRAGA